MERTILKARHNIEEFMAKMTFEGKMMTLRSFWKGVSWNVSFFFLEEFERLSGYYQLKKKKTKSREKKRFTSLLNFLEEKLKS